LPDTREHILTPQVCSSKFYSAELVAGYSRTYPDATGLLE